MESFRRDLESHAFYIVTPKHYPTKYPNSDNNE